MYCIRCGLELTDGQTVCPVCQTRVYHPDLPKSNVPPSYPDKEFQSEEINRKGILFVITVLALLPLVLPLVLELFLSGAIHWSGYVAGAVILIYLIGILPLWFKKRSPAIFVPSDFVAIVLYLFYINWQVKGDWFLSFAFPITASLGLIITAMAVLSHYLKRGYLYIYGGGLIAMGAWTVLIEFLIHVTFSVTTRVFWSLFPLISLFVLGMMLIVIEIVKPLKLSLHKFFFLG